MPSKGFLITLEGIDGSGKTLLIQNLQKTFDQKKLDILFTKEPGGTNLGKKLRKILQEEKEFTCDLAEFLLFAADRAQHFEQVIIPTIKDGKIVISDRLEDSSLVYQGYGRGLDIEMIKKVNNWAMQGIKPNLTLYLEIDAKTALQRVFNRNKALTSFEKEKMDFWQKVINGYQEIFSKRENVVKLDGRLSPDQVCKDAIKAIFSIRGKEAM